MPDERLNWLIIYADQQRTERILNLINKLDLSTEKEVARSQFKLYSLQHAVAKEVAILLKEVNGSIFDVAKNGKAANPALEPPAHSNSRKDGQVDEDNISDRATKTEQNQETAGQISITADETTNKIGRAHV